MREEPVFSGGIVKVVLLVLVAGALGLGVYALVGGGVDLPNLPDVPNLDTGTSPGVTNLENTTIEETTLGRQPPSNPFTSASFGDALKQVRDQVGDAELTQITVNDAQTQFIVRRGDGIDAYNVQSDGGLSHANATITISGNATIADFAFPLAGVQASSIDRMLAGSRKLSGDPGFRPSVLSLERAIPSGSRALEWTINGEGNGRFLTYKASADGGGVHAVGGGGVKVPAAAKQAQGLNDCIQAANQDPDKIFACLDRYQ